MTETCRVRLSLHTNSTLFTTCCRVAVCDDQEACPSCGAMVEPPDRRGRWNTAMLTFYGPEALGKMRADAARREATYQQRKRGQG